MLEHPVEADFGAVKINGGGLTITFNPTKSTYNFYVPADDHDGLVSHQNEHHGGTTGDTGEFDAGEVRNMAFHLVELFERRRRKALSEALGDGPTQYRDTISPAI